MAPSPARQKKRIFIVDDHALVREWLTNLVNQQPDLVACGEAASAPEALEKIADAKPDAAVVDISLKGPSGIELIKSLKQTQPDIAVIVLSMHDEPVYAERALRSGAKGYIAKREATKEIIKAIRGVLEGAVYVSESIRQTLALKFVSGSTLSDQPPVDQLSDREFEIFAMLGRGESAMQIAESLKINAKTVHTYCARIKEKLHLKTSAELFREAVRWQESHQSLS